MDEILARSEQEFGASARDRYERLIEQAVIDLAEDPQRNGTAAVGGRIHYHLRHSRLNVPRKDGRVRSPSHLIIAKVVGHRLVLLAMGHDGMVDDLDRRIQEGEDDDAKSP